MTGAALVLVCKKPELGVGKQRLAASFGKKITVKIARALLACALEDACNWPGPVVIAPANSIDGDWARAISQHIPVETMVVPQVGGNLGTRLNALDATLRAQNMTQLVYIGSDSPGLCEVDYYAVRESLKHNDVVLIPSYDGGVVLMANNHAWPDISNLPWSTAHLGDALFKVCEASMSSVQMLQKGFDIDEPDDFLQLATTLAEDQRPARRALHALACDIATLMSSVQGVIHA